MHALLAAAALILAAPAPKEVTATCKQVAQYAFSSCSRGYLFNGGNHDRESDEYQFGYTACNAAGWKAQTSCQDGTLGQYAGKTGQGECQDLKLFFQDHIVKGCHEVLRKDGKPVDEKLVKQCETVWAPRGAQEFATYCETESKKTARRGAPEDGAAL